MLPTYLRWPMLIGLFAAVVVLVTSLLQCISGRGEVAEVLQLLALALLFVWCNSRVNPA